MAHNRLQRIRIKCIYSHMQSGIIICASITCTNHINISTMKWTSGTYTILIFFFPTNVVPHFVVHRNTNNIFSKSFLFYKVIKYLQILCPYRKYSVSSFYITFSLFTISDFFNGIMLEVKESCKKSTSRLLSILKAHLN